MQTTLLGIAIAIILAVVVALVGPLLIDWTAYRPILQAEASRVLGADVTVDGAIDGRLLPSPRITLHNVTIGAGAERMRADELDLQFALTPLLRGTWQAEEMRLSGPHLVLRLDRAGRLHAPAMRASFDPDSISIERLQIEGGTLTLEGSERGANVTLTGLFFNGRARSLYGPFDGNGAFTFGSESYSLDNFSTGRLRDGAIRVRAAVQPGEYPYRLETEGTLTFADGKPDYEGKLGVAASPGLKRNVPSWHIAGRLKATPTAALLQDAELGYGTDPHAPKLTGVIRFDYARTPSLSAELSAARIDLDSAVGGTAGSPPAATLRKLVQESADLAFLSSVPVKAGLKIDEVVLGGGSLLEVTGDLASSRNGWELKPLQFRAPGFSKVAVSGALRIDNGNIAFTGPVNLDAGNPKVLFAWLEGRGQIEPDNARPLMLHGKVTLGSETIALDDVEATVEGEPLTGHVDYTFASAGRGARLDAVLAADRLDLDTAWSFGKALAAGSQMQWPETIGLRAKIGLASFRGFEGSAAAVDITYDNKVLNIAELSVADLGGAALAAKGELSFAAGGKPGKLDADLRAPDLAPVLAVLDRLSPAAAQALEPAQGSPADLHAELRVAPGNPLSRAVLTLKGRVGALDIALGVNGLTDFTSPGGPLTAHAQVASKDARTLLPLLRLDGVVKVADGSGTFTIDANGPLAGPLEVNANVKAPGLDARVRGRADLSAKRAANLQIDVRQANAVVAGGGPLPATCKGALALNGDTVTLTGIKATLGAANVNGRLTLRLGRPIGIGGALDVDTTVDVPAALAAALGTRLATSGPDGRWAWSSDPFLPSMFGKLDGDVALSANRVALLPAVAGRRFKADLHFGGQEIAVRAIDGELAGGRLTGAMTLAGSADGVTLDGRLALARADATMLIGSGARPPLTGALGLDLAFEGAGLSPVALVGSLHGKGEVTLADAQLAGLDPRAFEVVTRAVDNGMPIEPARISDIVGKALASGGLKVRRAEGPLALAAGQLRLAGMKATGADADVNLSGMLDMTDGLLDGRLVLSGTAQAGGLRPDIYMGLSGPIADPQHSIDVAALTGWLTLRGVEIQAKKVKALEEEAARRRAEEEAAAKRRAEEVRRRAEEEAARRALEEAKRQAEDEAKLRALLGTPGVLPAPPASPSAADPKPVQSGPADPTMTVQPSRTGNQAPAPGIVPLIQSAPILPPPVIVDRPPGGMPGRP